MNFYELIENESIARGALAAVVGLCIGSYLNVLAIRSLAEESIFPPSHCIKCNHNLGILDLVPLISFSWLNGKCRYCKAPISWQYPVVELFTALTFVVVSHVFEWPLEAIGMAIFASILIAVCITDFREKLIPHEITYPAIIIGIIFSVIFGFGHPEFYGGAQCGGPLMSSLAAAGVSYILFDFLAFYGLKIYMATHREPTKGIVAVTAGVPDGGGQRTISALTDRDIDLQIDESLIVDDEPIQEEEFEVMGGGDAVLSAVIGVWLGLPSLALVLVIAFLVGTLMGACYLIYEMHKEKILNQCLVPCSVGATIGLVLVSIFLGSVTCFGNRSGSAGLDLSWLGAAAVALLVGALFGVLSIGHKVSKPFPFGPALAFGAFVAMFYRHMNVHPLGGT